MVRVCVEARGKSASVSALRNVSGFSRRASNPTGKLSTSTPVTCASARGNPRPPTIRRNNWGLRSEEATRKASAGPGDAPERKSSASSGVVPMVHSGETPPRQAAPSTVPAPLRLSQFLQRRGRSNRPSSTASRMPPTTYGPRSNT